MELATPDIYISAKRSYILAIRESDMPIVVKMDETTKLIWSEGALIQVTFLKKGVISH